MFRFRRFIKSIMTIADTGCTMMTMNNNNNDGVSRLPCTPEDEKRIVTELTNKAEANLREGNTYYVISNRWFTGWQNYTGYGSDDYLVEDPSNCEDVILSDMSERPGPIDNSDIILSGSEGDEQLSMTLVETRDYVLVPQEVWEKLFEWYKGGPALPRKLISQGTGDRMFSVEVFPMSLKVIDSRDGSRLTISLSKKASIRDLYERVCSLTGIQPEKARMYDYYNRQKESMLGDSKQTLEEANLLMDQDILLEVLDDVFRPSEFGMDSTGNDLALVSVEPSRSSVTIAGGPTISNGYSAGHSSALYNGSTLNSASMDIDDKNDILSITSNGEKGGLAGLQNLGNTCFMNSALQCLVHTPPLVKYFLQNYTDDINTENPLGMRGELALAFGELLRKLWSSGRTTVVPRAFKGKLARFAPQFSGYNQHDSQELLAFLLDGLHEDLNRVKQKPYIESKDSDGRPDEEVAQECWKNHMARNDSLIVNVCQGQYKSTLVCPDCSKVSITFDPFMYLSLPLPSTTVRTMTVTVFYGDGNGLPMPYTVKVLKHGCCKDLLQALGAECCLKSDESLLLAEVYNNKIYKYFENSESLNLIKDEEYIVAYLIPKRCAGLTRLQIVHHEKSTSDTLKINDRKLVGSPLVTYLGESPIKGADIYTTVSKMLTPLKRKTFISPSKTHSCKENGSASEAVGESENSYNNDSESSCSESIEAGGTSNGELLSRLYLTDSGLSDPKLVDRDITVKASQEIMVLMDWTEKEHEIYDTSYLRDLPVVFKTVYTFKKTRQEAISLFSCLEAFLKEEPLGPDDMWYCPGCKEHKEATKKLDLWRLPDILVFHLKRFSYSRYLKNKLDTFVNFPIHNLDLSKYVKNNDAHSNVYELYAISNHYGGLGGGHYSAYAKLLDEDRWYHFDDSHVSPVNEDDIKTAAAYVLFYKRVTGQPKKEPEESPSQSDTSL